MQEAQAAPQMVTPRRQACDFIFLAGSNIESEHVVAVQSLCQESGLKIRSAMAKYMSQSVFEEVTKWHRDGDLDNATVVKIDAHGSMENGRHVLNFMPYVETLALIRHIRGGGLQFNRPWFGGTIILFACEMDLREALAVIPGDHVAVGGKKAVSSCYGPALDQAMLPLMAAEKASGKPGLSGDAIFDQLSLVSPCTLSISGANRQTRVFHIKSPQAVSNAGYSWTQTLVVFRERVMVGKVAQVKEFIDSDRRLLEAVPGYPSGFACASDRGRVDMMQFLMSYDHQHWRHDLRYLLPAARKHPQLAARAQVLINRVLRNSLQSEFAKSGKQTQSPEQAYALALTVVVNHVRKCLLNSTPWDVQTLRGTLSQDAPPPNDASAAVDWHLLDNAANIAAQRLKLADQDVAAFKADFLSELEALC